MKTVAFWTRLTPEVMEKLAERAKKQRRSKASLGAQYIEAYLRDPSDGEGEVRRKPVPNPESAPPASPAGD